MSSSLSFVFFKKTMAELLGVRGLMRDIRTIYVPKRGIRGVE